MLTLKDKIKKITSKHRLVFFILKTTFFYFQSFKLIIDDKYSIRRFEKAIKQNERYPNKDSLFHKPLAFVSCFPPESSGIATYSLKIFSSAPSQVDVFCPVYDIQTFNNNKQLLSAVGNSLFPVERLFYLDASAKYEKIIIALGNSFHHVYAAHLLKILHDNKMNDRVVLYLHDLNLHGLLVLSRNFNILRYLISFFLLYRGDHTPFFSSMGIKMLISKVGVARLLVNSAMARDLLLSEVENKSSVVVDKIFLPVFPFRKSNQQILKKHHGTYYVGTFGIPSSNKCTDVIIESVNELISEGYNLKLVVAGWRAREFFNDTVPEFVLVFDSLTDEELATLMSEMDLAIQLRQQSVGESSGCIPLLLSLGVGVIVSNLGSFTEYSNRGIDIVYDNSVDAVKTAILKHYKNGNSTTNIYNEIPLPTAKDFIERIDMLYNSGSRS